MRTQGLGLGGLTCSIGCAEYRPGEAPGELVDRVDKALYQAKEFGRNRVVAEAGNELATATRQVWTGLRPSKPR